MRRTAAHPTERLAEKGVVGVEDVRMVRNACQRAGAARTRGADVAPAHFLEREVLGGGRRTCTYEDEESGSKNEAIAHARYGNALQLVKCRRGPSARLAVRAARRTPRRRRVRIAGRSDAMNDEKTTGGPGLATPMSDLCRVP